MYGKKDSFILIHNKQITNSMEKKIKDNEYTPQAVKSANGWWNDLSQENQMLELARHRNIIDTNESTFTMKNPTIDEIIEMYFNESR